jgi:hypothetical protein
VKSEVKTLDSEGIGQGVDGPPAKDTAVQEVNKSYPFPIKGMSSSPKWLNN